LETESARLSLILQVPGVETETAIITGGDRSGPLTSLASMNDRLKIALLIGLNLLMGGIILSIWLKPKEKETVIIDLGDSRVAYWKNLAKTKDEILEDVINDNVPGVDEQDRIIAEYWRRLQRQSDSLQRDRVQGDHPR
jgi:hypothetical protein